MGNEIKLYEYLISTINSAEWLASILQKNGAPVGSQTCSGLKCKKTHVSTPTAVKH
jgi:hypothetical protein